MARFWLNRFFSWRDRAGNLHLVPSPWPEFCRWCWAKYGTGRTERDTPRPYLRRYRPAMTWPEFNRYCWKHGGTGRTEPDKPKENENGQGTKNHAAR